MTKARDLANASTALSAVSATELGYLDGVTSAVQTQLDNKQAINANVSTTELGYLDGVTSAIQTQLDAKLASATAATTYVANALADAKGDLLTASANDTPARLAVGNNGETLVADSSQAVGLRYNPQNALVNPVINGGFDIAQRGTSVSIGASANGYTLDRWFYGTAANQASTISQQATGDTTNLPNIQSCVRVQRNSGQTGAGATGFDMSMETRNSIPYAGKTVTISFYARAGALYSPTSGVLNAQLVSGTGTDQSVSFGYTGSSTVISQNATLTTTWQRFAYTGTIAATATELAIRFISTWVGTAGATDYYEVTGVQIDLGTYTASTAPTFRRSGGTIQGELAACQYYYKPTLYGIGKFTATTTAVLQVNYGIMRITPSLLFVSGGIDEIGVTTRTATAITSSGLGAGTGYVTFTVSGATSGAICGPATTLLVNVSSEL